MREKFQKYGEFQHNGNELKTKFKKKISKPSEKKGMSETVGSSKNPTFMTYHYFNYIFLMRVN